VGKKRIIIIAAAGLVSFVGMFAFAWFTGGPSKARGGEVNEQAVADLKSPQPQAGPLDAVDADQGSPKNMTEKQLHNLVYEVREKMREYNDKLQALGVREQRLQVAQDMLKEDIENLNNLRVELASVVAGLKEEQDKLLKSRIEIDKTEKNNLVSIAAAYDKMDSSSAGKIIASMCMNQTQKGGVVVGSGSFEDAVKILHYMTERTKAKLLAELVASEPKLAAVLCQKLKQIVEGQ